jgi:cell division protein FtsZ
MAISSPLLEASIDGAHGVLLSVAGGSDLGLFEINEAAQLVADAAHPEANIIFGAVIDDALGDEVRVTVIAAGFDGGRPAPARPESRRQAAAAEAAAKPATAAAPARPKTATAPGPTATRRESPTATTWKPAEPVPQRRTIVFDDSDDLDVPDFLK